MTEPQSAPAEQLEQFLQLILGDEFHGLAVVFEGRHKTSRFYPPARFGDMCQDIRRLSADADVYVSVGTQDRDWGPKKRGSGASVVAVGGFFADIDFASNKSNGRPYPPDLATALRSLDQFEHPPTATISTGNGLHAHWAFETSVLLRTDADRNRHRKERRAFQLALADVFGAAGYTIDDVSDLARVYRPPGTLNHKGSAPKRVEMLSFEPKNRISPDAYLPQAGEGRRNKTKKGGPTYQHEKVRTGCGWYSFYTGEGAAACPEPDWWAAASITARTVDGEALFHAYSRSHPAYDRREAARKFERALTEAGPRTCAAIREAGNERFCDRCKHWGVVHSPLDLGAYYDPGTTGPIPLGYVLQGQFALLDQERQIVLLQDSGQLLSPNVLRGLADSLFWSAQFGDGKGGFDPGAAGEALIRACRAIGPFDPLKLRGRGVWREGTRIIINLGEPVPSDTRYRYVCFEPLVVDRNAAFTGERLDRLLAMFPWRRPSDAKLLLGWLAIAPICGALDWRPHCFLYGPPNSGKTTLHKLARALLTPLGLAADGQSTEAGIRQSLGPDSRPIVIDEFETDQRANRLAGVVRLDVMFPV